MQNKNLKSGLEIFLITCILALFYLTGLSNVAFHPDESQWIATSNVFETYLKADFKSSLWNPSYWTLTQPPLVRYVIGLGRRVGGYPIPDLNRPWNFERSKAFNLRKGAMPSDGLLWWARLPMAILASLSLSFVFALLQSSVGRFSAYIWLLLSFANPYFLLHLRRAMGESCLLFFTLLATYATYQALKSISKEIQAGRRHAFIWLAVAGICCGLAGTSKLNGFANLGACLFIVFLASWKLKTANSEKVRFALIGSALAGFACSMVFFVVNPFLWPNPVGRTIAMFQNRALEMNYQITIYSADYISSWAQRFEVIPMRIFENYSALQVPFFINFGLFISGLGLAYYFSWQWFQKKDVSAAYLVLLVTAFFLATPSLFTNLDWDRYYLFPVFFSTVFISIALGWISSRIFHWVAPNFLVNLKSDLY